MSVERTEMIRFHLGQQQKRALKERARAKGTNVTEELRAAVDAYLSDDKTRDLELLNAAAGQAALAIAEMNDMLDATNRKANLVFAELERLRGGRPVGAEARPAPSGRMTSKRRAAS